MDSIKDILSQLKKTIPKEKKKKMKKRYNLNSLI